MLKTQRLALSLSLLLCSATGACDKPADKAPAEPAPVADGEPAQASGSGAEAKPGYACPSISTSMVDGENPPEHGLGLGISVPEGFTWSKQQAPEHGELIQIGRFELPFTTPTDKRHPERLAIIQVEHGPSVALASAPPLPKETIPYVMGSGGDDEAAAEALAAGKGLLAGERELGDQRLPILRQPGREAARFKIRYESEGRVHDVTVSVYAAKLHPITTNDMQGAACIADFDRVALEVIKQLAPAS